MYCNTGDEGPRFHWDTSHSNFSAFWMDLLHRLWSWSNSSFPELVGNNQLGIGLDPDWSRLVIIDDMTVRSQYLDLKSVHGGVWSCDQNILMCRGVPVSCHARFLDLSIMSAWSGQTATSNCPPCPHLDKHSSMDHLSIPILHLTSDMCHWGVRTC